MILFKDRASLLIYMPAKPTKWGLKAWGLANMKTSYMYNWQLYLAREIAQSTKDICCWPQSHVHPVGEYTKQEICNLHGHFSFFITCIILPTNPTQNRSMWHTTCEPKVCAKWNDSSKALRKRVPNHGQRPMHFIYLLVWQKASKFGDDYPHCWDIPKRSLVKVI